MKYLFISLILVSTLFLLGGCSAAEQQIDHAWHHLSTSNDTIPSPGPGSQQTASLILDVDNDGLNDFVIAERESAPAMQWFKRGQKGWTKYVIEAEHLRIEAGGAYHDIDDDGDLDIVMGGDASTNQVWWWENPSPQFESDIPWQRRLVKDTGETKHHDQIFGDFDHDGRTELVFWNQKGRKLLMAEIPQDARSAEPWDLVEIFTWEKGQLEGLARTDVDGDGDLDLVGGGRWFEYNDDDGMTAHIIDTKQGFTRAAAGQLIPGGWAEIVFVSGDKTGRLVWYRWDGSAWVGTDLLGFDVDHGHSLQIADEDGDGNLDIFCAEMRLQGDNLDAKAWLFYGDGQGDFTSTVVSQGYGNHESRLGDLDGDGDLDILSKPYNWETPRVDILLQQDPQDSENSLSPDLWQRHVIDSDRPWRAIFIVPADIDGDGFDDIVTGGWWYRNPGNAAGLWIRQTIGSPLHNMAAVFDFDGDGDSDVLGTQGQGSEPSSDFVWAKNDGGGQFTILENIENGNGDFLQGAAVTRFGPSQMIDVALSWHNGGPGVQLLAVPTDPSSNHWTISLLSSVTQAEELSANDIDGDGDTDLLLGTKWLRNDLPNQWASLDLHQLRPSNDAPDRNRLADINDDGHLDAIVGYEGANRSRILAWYEQSDDLSSYWSEHIIAKTTGPMSIDVADMDDDGDLDVIVGEHNTKNPKNASLWVFINEDGHGTKWKQSLVHQGDEHHNGAQVVDIDHDGDLDIISIGWTHSRVLLYENLTK